MASPRSCGLDMVVIAITMAALISIGLGLGRPFQMPHLKLKVDRRQMFDVWFNVQDMANDVFEQKCYQ